MLGVDKTDPDQPLRLVLRSGKPQLITTDTIYSNGMKYRPFGRSYTKIYPEAGAPQNMLLLGAGMGSALEILQKQYDYRPSATLVDNQGQILTWSQDYSPLEAKEEIQWVEQDAQDFLKSTSEKYDLIGVDLFMRLEPRSFIYDESFVKSLSDATATDGHVIINTIVRNGEEMSQYLPILYRYFEIIDMISEGRSRYIILRKK